MYLEKNVFNSSEIFKKKYLDGILKSTIEYDWMKIVYQKNSIYHDEIKTVKEYVDKLKKF